MLGWSGGGERTHRGGASVRGGCGERAVCEIPSGESKVRIEVLSVLWGNRLSIPDGSLPLSRCLLLLIVSAGSSSSVPADYVSAGHVLVSADRDRIC
ncbi:hypothetical protein Tco_0305324 [Tanacetum coccineum]